MLSYDECHDLSWLRDAIVLQAGVMLNFSKLRDVRWIVNLQFKFSPCFGETDPELTRGGIDVFKLANISTALRLLSMRGFLKIIHE